MKKTFLAIVIVALMSMFTPPAMAQNPLPAGGTLVQPAPAQYSLIPISATAAVNNQTTLSIPAPPAGLSIYVCSIALIISQDGTATANVNVVTTSTNFNSFALKWSTAATANLANMVGPIQFGAPATGCAKSTASGTATTFVSPAAAANTAYTWLSTYFFAP